VVLTGNGKSFSAGADLNWMKKMASYTQVRRYSSILSSHHPER
jgi:methylglutaconyl-CoA hydratase